MIIIGIVNTPVDRTLTIGPPVIVQNIAELTIAACAGPPRNLRVQRKPSLISVCPPADLQKSAPKSMKNVASGMRPEVLPGGHVASPASQWAGLVFEI